MISKKNRLRSLLTRTAWHEQPVRIHQLIVSIGGLEKQIQDREIGEMIGKKSVGELAEKLAENLEKTREDQKAPPVKS